MIICGALTTFAHFPGSLESQKNPTLFPLKYPLFPLFLSMISQTQSQLAINLAFKFVWGTEKQPSF